MLIVPVRTFDGQNHQREINQIFDDIQTKLISGRPAAVSDPDGESKDRSSFPALFREGQDRRRRGMS